MWEKPRARAHIRYTQTNNVHKDPKAHVADDPISIYDYQQLVCTRIIIIFF